MSSWLELAIICACEALAVGLWTSWESLELTIVSSVRINGERMVVGEFGEERVMMMECFFELHDCRMWPVSIGSCGCLAHRW